MSKTRKILSKSEQERLLSEYSRSGLSKSAYCESVGISESAFYRYKKKHQSVGKFVSIRKPLVRDFYVKLFGIKLIRLELSV